MVNLAPLKKIKLAPPKSNQIKLAPPQKILAPSKSGRKTLSTTPPPVEFTKPHRLPPLEIGSENPLNYPPARIHETSSTTPPPRNRVGKLHHSINYPPSNSRPERKFAPPKYSIPRSATGPSPPNIWA